MKLSCAKCMRLGRTLLTVSGVALLFSVPGFGAQSQSNQKESLGEAARKARQQKKPATKPAKVLTDDDLAMHKAAASGQPAQSAGAPAQAEAPAAEAPEQAAQGESAPPEAPAAEAPEQAAQGESAPPEASAPPTPQAGEPEQRAAGLDADLKSAKQELAEAERELNLLQREFDLRRDQYYSNPDFKFDKRGKAQLDSLQQQVSVRQQEFERLKQKAASLEAERKSLPGAPPPPAQEKPAAPPQS